MVKLSTAALNVLILFQGVSSWSNNDAWTHRTPHSTVFSNSRRMSTSKMFETISKPNSARPSALSLSPNDIFNKPLSETTAVDVQSLNVDVETLKDSVARFGIDFEEILSGMKSITGDIKMLEINKFMEAIENIVVTTQKYLLSAFADTYSLIPFLSDDFLTSTFQDKPLPEAIVQLYETAILPIRNSLPEYADILISAGLTYFLLTFIFNLNSSPPPSSPYPLKRYDAAAARAYFDNRLDLVIIRALEVAALSARFGVNLGIDYLNKNFEKNAELRAEQLTELLTTLGPSFIKIGQSLSIRTDLLSPAYVRGLKKLQDQVPPFPSSEAYAIISEDLGMNVEDIFESIGDEPVAAASLGQVYKAVLKDSGKTVAVKVQRPDIMNKIALDMYLIRDLAAVLKRTFNLNTDLVGTTDAWGIGFVDELNYYDEAENAMRFTESMQTTPLANVVFSPPVIEEFTSERVLVTEWVDGERLDRSEQKDVTVLCSIAMNTYLTMMLETGVLHCDPHPGNLLRTQDGRLCILDWGMVTRLDPNLQLTLIEHMAHLTSADYAEVPGDLLVLGFIPESKKDLIKDSGVVETLADIYGAWTKGGGAASINVNKVIAQLQDLTAEKGNLFQIPAYFAYIAKSFSVLEGIGLSNDSNYSIINECLPYVSKRLLTDKSERTGGALGTFIFGPDKNDVEKRIVSYDRVEQLVTGFGDYSISASGALLGKEGASRVQMFEETADQILDLVVSEEETPLQNILTEQLAKIISSSTRSAWADLRERSGTLPSGRSVLGTLVDPLGLWRTSPVVRMNDLDVKTVDTTRDLIKLIQDQSTANDIFSIDNMSNEEVVELSQVLVRKIWERRRAVALTGGRLANMLVKMTADKLEKGERDLMILPEALVEDSNPSVEHGENNGMELPRSQRLENAQQLLAQFEREVQ